jgi:uncharacterized protein (DUF4415 family)
MQKSEHIVRYTADEIDEKLRRGGDRTDWERVQNLTYEEIEASVDFEDEGTFDWSTARADMPQPKRQLTVRLDQEVIDWFKSQGPGYQTRMNAVLRSYVNAHRR